MRNSFLVFIIVLSVTQILKGARTVHVFVALCDNKYQNIHPVPRSLGNGQKPESNLYWGAVYGIKSFFKYRAKEWKLVRIKQSKKNMIIEQLLFKHVSKDVFMLAEAYKGREIKSAVREFLKASNSQNLTIIKYEGKSLHFGGGSDLVAYIGHNGLMDFDLQIKYKDIESGKKQVIILACSSKKYFACHVRSAGAEPLLWTSNLMAPEAYTLKAALDGWIRNESGENIVKRAAEAYNKYQKCGLKGAMKLFKSGF